MFIICKEFRFEAAHQLEGLPPGHQCSRMHGHSYRVEVFIRGEVDDVGMVIDFAKLAPFKRFIDTNVDHRLLNDMWPQPTAERIAEALYIAVAQLVPLPPGVQVDAVRVWETATCWAECRP